jgi:hypothetical protein
MTAVIVTIFASALVAGAALVACIFAWERYCCDTGRHAGPDRPAAPTTGTRALTRSRRPGPLADDTAENGRWAAFMPWNCGTGMIPAPRGKRA